jgi:hypothetical protein
MVQQYSFYIILKLILIPKADRTVATTRIHSTREDKIENENREKKLHSKNQSEKNKFA